MLKIGDSGKNPKRVRKVRDPRGDNENKGWKEDINATSGTTIRK
jgi:hypothetical protein